MSKAKSPLSTLTDHMGDTVTLIQRDGVVKERNLTEHNSGASLLDIISNLPSHHHVSVLVDTINGAGVACRNKFLSACSFQGIINHVWSPGNPFPSADDLNKASKEAGDNPYILVVVVPMNQDVDAVISAMNFLSSYLYTCSDDSPLRILFTFRYFSSKFQKKMGELFDNVSVYSPSQCTEEALDEVTSRFNVYDWPLSLLNGDATSIGRLFDYIHESNQFELEEMDSNDLVKVIIRKNSWLNIGKIERFVTQVCSDALNESRVGSTTYVNLRDLVAGKSIPFNYLYKGGMIFLFHRIGNITIGSRDTLMFSISDHIIHRVFKRALQNFEANVNGIHL